MPHHDREAKDVEKDPFVVPAVKASEWIAIHKRAESAEAALAVAREALDDILCEPEDPLRVQGVAKVALEKSK